MAQSNDFICDDCGESCSQATITDPATGESHTLPLVAYIVVGPPPSVRWCPQCDRSLGPADMNEKGFCLLHPKQRTQTTVDVTAKPLPAIIRRLLEQPVARREFCVACFAKAVGVKVEPAPRRVPVEELAPPAPRA